MFQNWSDSVESLLLSPWVTLGKSETLFPCLQREDVIRLCLRVAGTHQALTLLFRLCVFFHLIPCTASSFDNEETGAQRG